MKTLCALLVFATLTSFSVAQEASMGQEAKPLHLMPWPSDVKTSAGQMVIDPSFSVTLHGTDPRLKKTAEIFLEDLRRHTGMLPLDFSIAESPAPGHPVLSITSEH